MIQKACISGERLVLPPGPNSGWQGGRVVRVLDFESVGPGFESHSEHFMDLFLGCPEL